jgi:hypothetical protein
MKTGVAKSLWRELYRLPHSPKNGGCGPPATAGLKKQQRGGHLLSPDPQKQLRLIQLVFVPVFGELVAMLPDQDFFDVRRLTTYASRICVLKHMKDPKFAAARLAGDGRHFLRPFSD